MQEKKILKKIKIKSMQILIKSKKKKKINSSEDKF